MGLIRMWRACPQSRLFRAVGSRRLLALGCGILATLPLREQTVCAQTCQPVPNEVAGLAMRLPWQTGETYTAQYGYCASHHCGYQVDFNLPQGTPVVAVADGVVVQVGDNANNCWPSSCGDGILDGGIFVKIQHTSSGGIAYDSAYLHLSQRLKNCGDDVDQGEIIGYSGNSGYSSGPHLHFHIRRANADTCPDPTELENVRPVPMVGLVGSTEATIIEDFVPGETYTAIDVGPLTGFTGFVTYQASGTPVSGATVTWGPYTATTSSSGQFVFENVACGTQPLQACTPQGLCSAPYDYAPPCDGSGQQNPECPDGQCEEGGGPGEGQFQPGDTVQVANTQGYGLRAWTEECTGTYIVKPDGATGTIVDGPQCCGGYVRWRIQWSDDQSIRWSAEGDAATGEMWVELVPDCLSSPVESAKLIASDSGTSDLFGGSVTVSGDTAVVGAHFDNHEGGVDAGSAYVFVRPAGNWTQQAKLTASDASGGDLFGVSVAVQDDTAVVGAFWDDHAGGINAGSAYVFIRSGGVWTQQTKLVASDAAEDDFFGNRVALSGDTAIIGAWDDTNAGGTDAGSAYVFVRSGGVWNQQAKLVASDGAAHDLFGSSVGLSGDTAIVGAQRADHDGLASAGAAYVFVRTGSVWTQQQKITASDAAAVDLFGQSVAIDTDTIVVGAVYDDHSGEISAGSAYVFVRSGGMWTQQAKLTASDAAANDNFGYKVGVAGNAIAVGAVQDDHAGGIDAGSAYLFARTGTVWTEQAKLVASDAATNDRFGFSVALSGHTAIVGAGYDDHSGAMDAGSAYTFDINTDPLAGDCDLNCYVDIEDCAGFVSCMSGPGVADGTPCGCYSLDGDTDVDLRDFATLANAFTG